MNDYLPHLVRNKCEHFLTLMEQKAVVLRTKYTSMPKAPKKEEKKAPKKAVAKTVKKVATKTVEKVAAKATKKIAKPSVKKAKPAAKKAKPAAKKVKPDPKETKTVVLKIKDKAIKNLVDVIIDGIQDIKGKDIVVLDLTELQNAVTDYFIIATGDSSTQVEGMASAVVRKTRKELRERPWHEEGVGNSEWILLDYVNVVVHIFYRETREFYNLEDLWADAKRTEIPTL